MTGWRGLLRDQSSMFEQDVGGLPRMTVMTYMTARFEIVSMKRPC
jgi:hypothetical protein